MSLPMAPRDNGPGACFACTGCGDCCRGFGRESAAWEQERGPLIRLSNDPGLPLMSWERQRFLRLSAERRAALDIAPFDGVLDEAGRRVVVMSYRMAAWQCPFLAERADLAPGPRSVAWSHGHGGICSVYEDRPLACRAYPLVPLRGGVALSLHCPEIVDADLADRNALLRVYGDSLPAAEAFRAAPDLAVRLVQQLERRGAIRYARDAQPLAAEARAAWPRVDLCDLAEAHGLGAWTVHERRARSPS